MGILGDVAKGLRIFAFIVWVVLILQFILINQIAIALVLIFGLIITLSLLAFGYRKRFREFQCRKCNHRFKVSHLRLALTLKFGGRDPAPTGTAAYHLKCPKCGNKSWLVPLD
jgi:ribosomal protein L37E